MTKQVFLRMAKDTLIMGFAGVLVAAFGAVIMPRPAYIRTIDMLLFDWVITYQAGYNIALIGVIMFGIMAFISLVLVILHTLWRN